MISFVILHYLAVDSTLKCIDCIKALGGDNNVVVVDNASPDGSGPMLADKFKNDGRVFVVLNDENAGFARGNNLGIAYACENFDPDFVVVLNDDVEIEQTDFCERIYEIYDQHPFDLLGPDIISQYSGVHQSPKHMRGCSLDSVRKKAAYVRRSQNPVLLYLSSGEKSNGPLWRWVLRRRRRKSGIDFSAPAQGVVLHGSCVIFSRRFLNGHLWPFYPGTFMYYEMEILEWLCRRDGSVVRYDPSLNVLHHQNVATGMQYRSIVSRTRFVTECLLESLAAAEELILCTQAVDGDEVTVLASQPAAIQLAPLLASSE